MATKSNATTTSLAPNVASALCYVPFIGWVAAIVLFIVEKNAQVKWHAVQALLLAAAIWVLSFLMGITIILLALSPLVWIGGLILNLVLAVKAYQNQAWRLPVLAGWADKITGKA